MNPPTSSYKRRRFPPQIIAHAVWLYFRFPLSLRLVEEMQLERGIAVSYETVRRWAMKFGPDYARRLKRKKPGRRLQMAVGNIPQGRSALLQGVGVCQSTNGAGELGDDSNCSSQEEERRLTLSCLRDVA